MRHTLTRRTRWAAVGAAGAIVLGGAGVAVAAEASPSPSPSSGTSAPERPAHTPHIGGTLTAKDGSTLTVTDPDGFQRAVHVDGSTKYTKDGKTVTLDSIATGTRVVAAGSVASDHTTLNATSVEVAPARDGRGPGGHGPDGKGPDGKGPDGNGGPGRHLDDHRLPDRPGSGTPTPGS